MTFLEKAKSEDVELRKDGLPILCPYKHGYEEYYVCNNVKCVDCWNREMPNTESKVDAYKEDMHTAYNKGLNDGRNEVWELYRKAGEMSDEDYDRCFGLKSHEGLTDLSPQEALAKLKAYEEAQIEVGDVLGNDKNDMLVIVTKVYDTAFDCIDNSGIVRASLDKTLWKKTGKHIDIKSILESIGD